VFNARYGINFAICCQFNLIFNTMFWCRNLKERDHLEDPSVNGRIILRWFFRKWDLEAIDLIDLA